MLRLSPRVVAEDAATNSMRPTFAIRETFSRQGAVTAATGVTGLQSGRLELVSIWLQAGDLVSNISFVTGSSGAVNPSHQVFALYGSDRVLLGQTANDGATAWTAGVRKALNMVAPYRVPASGRYMVGMWVVADTPPNLHGAATVGTLIGFNPIVVGVSSTGLTDTAPPVAGALLGRNGTAYATVG